MVAVDGGLAILPPLTRWGCRTIGPHMHFKLMPFTWPSGALLLTMVLHALQEPVYVPGQQAGRQSAFAICSDKRRCFAAQQVSIYRSSSTPLCLGWLFRQLGCNLACLPQCSASHTVIGLYQELHTISSC